MSCVIGLHPKYSVLMSVYTKEQPGYLLESLESIVGQQLLPTEVVLVEDGPVGEELLKVIDSYRDKLTIISVKLPVNVGLAQALNVGLRHCNESLVARMDTDDICAADRFIKQVDFMSGHPEIAVSSSWVEECNSDMTRVLGIRVLPEHHVEIVKFAKRRSPISHPAAIFRREAVISAGGYPIQFPEDYALWSLMIVQGYEFANLPEVLLRMRTGDDFIARRGFDFFKGEVKLLKYQYDIGFIGKIDYFINLTVKSIVRLTPCWCRKLLYRFAR
jgi:glycosyltransferase involved in cell wall biosynthesis